jgi:hypothetical protein
MTDFYLCESGAVYIFEDGRLVGGPKDTEEENLDACIRERGVWVKVEPMAVHIEYLIMRWLKGIREAKRGVV